MYIMERLLKPRKRRGEEEREKGKEGGIEGERERRGRKGEREREKRGRREERGRGEGKERGSAHALERALT